MTFRDYQVAVSNDRHLLARKWDCLGTFRAASHRSAAFAASKSGNVVAEHPDPRGVVFEFPNNVFVRVGFGA